MVRLFLLGREYFLKVQMSWRKGSHIIDTSVCLLLRSEFSVYVWFYPILNSVIDNQVVWRKKHWLWILSLLLVILNKWFKASLCLSLLICKMSTTIPNLWNGFGYNEGHVDKALSVCRAFHFFQIVVKNT